MPFDEISGIKSAEEAAVKSRLAAQSAAEAAEAEAEKTGAALVADARRRAEEESAVLMSKADQDAADFAALLRAQTADGRNALRAAAQSHMDDAAAIIVKKVVEG